MKQGKLTRSACAVTSIPLRDEVTNSRAASRMAMLLFALTTLGGCITVNAPEEPIVIELNVNIRQEVIYQLAGDANNTIEENDDIF